MKDGPRLTPGNHIVCRIMFPYDLCRGCQSNPSPPTFDIFHTALIFPEYECVSFDFSNREPASSIFGWDFCKQPQTTKNALSKTSCSRGIWTEN